MSALTIDTATIVGVSLAWLVVGVVMGLVPACFAKRKGYSPAPSFILSALIGASILGWLFTILLVAVAKDREQEERTMRLARPASKSAVITITCWRCNTKYRVNQDLAEKVKCLGCGRKNVG